MGAFYEEALAGSHAVPVPFNFIEDYLPDAEGDFLKVYLFGLAHWTLQDGLTHEALAEALHMSLAQVQKAWSYWARVGLVSLHKADDGSYTVRFKQKLPKKASSSAKVYTSLEMNRALDENRALHDMFLHVEAERGGKPLSPQFRQMLFRFYDQLKLPVEVIVLLVHYAVSVQKNSVRAMESLAAHWAEEGITTYEKAEAYCREKANEKQALLTLEQSLAPLQKLLDINPYAYRLSEQKKMGTWLCMGFSPEMLLLAKQVTLQNTEEKAFVPGYMHSVLETWKKEGFKTPEDITKEQAAPKTKPKAAKKRSYELNEFERIALHKNLEYLKKKKGDSA